MLYATPTKPGHARLIAGGFSEYPEGVKPPGLLPLILKLTPKWFQHLKFPEFLYQDNAFLHGQEKAMARQGYNTNGEVCFSV